MNIKQRLSVRSEVFKEQVNKYALLGLLISIGSILVASMLVSYQLTGRVSLSGMILAQLSNPAIWALDLTPFMFAYWGQLFCDELAHKAESIIEGKTREFIHKSDDLAHQLAYESQHDSLTRLPNERLLLTRMKQGIAQINAGEALALILLDIKNFKEIIYHFGIFNGNSLLVQFSEQLKSILLAPYLLQAHMGMNMIARRQGSEFAILIPRLKKEHHFEEILKKIIDETSTTFMIDGNAIDIKTRLGAALYPNHGRDEKELIHNATLCLFHAEKDNDHRNIYDPSMNVHNEFSNQRDQNQSIFYDERLKR